MLNAKGLIFSSKCYEGAPLTILEAVALGLPCISSANCAASEFINKKNGLLFDNTVEDLINKIKMYEKMDLTKLSESAYKDYWDNPFDTNRYIKNLISTYKKILKGK